VGTRSLDVEVPLTPPQAVGAVPVRVVAPAAGPAPDAPTVVLAHGAGSGPDSDVLVATADALVAAGAAAVTFPFAYRAAGRRAPDPAARLLSAWRDVVAWARTSGPARQGGPVVLGGRSMGGRYASLAAADGLACDGLLLLAYPLRAAGRPDRPPRTAHWPDLRVPVHFVSGDRDALCDLADLDAARRSQLRAAPSSVHVVRGADHGFRVRVRDSRSQDDVLGDIAAAAARWIAALPRPTADAGRRGGRDRVGS